MKLPSGHRAVIEDAKLREYILNPAHPVGRHHAVLFERLLGITCENAEVLKNALRLAAAEGEVSQERRTPHGRKYTIRFPMRGPEGLKTVLSIWIVETGSEIPRLVTSYVE